MFHLAIVGPRAPPVKLVAAAVVAAWIVLADGSTPNDGSLPSHAARGLTSVLIALYRSIDGSDCFRRMRLSVY